MWGRAVAPAGIVGIVLAFLLHGTITILALYDIYGVMGTTAISRREGSRARRAEDASLSPLLRSRSSTRKVLPQDFGEEKSWLRSTGS